MQTPSSLNQLSHAEKDALILMLQGQITVLQEAVKQMQSRLNMSHSIEDNCVVFIKAI